MSRLLSGEFPDAVHIILPRGERVAFALAETVHTGKYATAGIVKDAGDDPDVTHEALVLGDAIATAAWDVASRVLQPTEIELEIVVRGRAPFTTVHDRPPGRKRR